MNIINSALLRFALLPSALYRKIGVNTQHLGVILNAKLIMDDRRPNTFQQIQRKRNNKPVSTATLGTMLWSAFMGLIFLLSFMFGKSYETKFTIYFSFYVTVLASILIADFTSVLIDIRDNFIILPKPVNDKTFVVSRLLHIFIHVCKMVIPMILPAVVYLIINKSIFSIIPFLFVTLMATLFTIFLINACYILILKIISPSKFQTIISYIQIVFAIVFYAGYQLVPRLIDTTSLSQYELSERSWIVFLPSYWFAGAWQQLYIWNNTFKLWMCLALTIVVPLSSIWIVIKYFAPSFNQKLSMITGSTGEASTSIKNKRKSASFFYSTTLSKLFTKKGVERMSFLFTWKMMLRSRGFKMKVYPTIGYLVVITVAMLLMGNKTLSFSDIVSQTKQGILYTLIVIYFSNLILITALGQITMHEKYKAAWIFFTTPVARPGKLVSGAVKAATAQFYFPIATVIFVLITLLAGPAVIPNLLFGIANELLITAISSYIGASKLPFSSPQQNESGTTVRVFAVMILGVGLAFIHYLLYHILIVVSILAVLSFVAAWYIFDAASTLSWEKIYSKYIED
jgi:ABC-2 type transport system permease protein